MAVEAVGANAGYQTAVANTSTKSVQQVKDAAAESAQTEQDMSSVSQGNGFSPRSDTSDTVSKDAGESPVANQAEQNEQIRKSVEAINKKLTNNTECQFGIHEKTNRITIKIVDKDTQEVIREVPAEKTLEMIAKVWEFAGLLVDEKR